MTSPASAKKNKSKKMGDKAAHQGDEGNEKGLHDERRQNKKSYYSMSGSDFDLNSDTSDDNDI